MPECETLICQSHHYSKPRNPTFTHTGRIMANSGESSSTQPKTTDEKPVIVRVKRKLSQSRVDAFWLEINERPFKRPLLDFEKLSLSDNSVKEELKAKTVFVQLVETVTTSETTIDIVQSFVQPNSAAASDGKTKNEERRLAFKKDNRHDQNLFKARQKQEVLAKSARFEQIWRSRKGKEGQMDDKVLCEMCQFYDVRRVDTDERGKEVQKPEDMSMEDSRILTSYLPLLREFLPSAAEDIESDDYVYDYYTVKNDMDLDDNAAAANLFPRVQVDDEDFYDGPDESESDSQDSNAEGNPQNDYPDEMSEEEEEEEDDINEEEGEEGEEAEEESETSDGTEGDCVDDSSDFPEHEDVTLYGTSSDADLFHVDDEIYCSDYRDDEFYYYDSEEGGW